MTRRHRVAVLVLPEVVGFDATIPSQLFGSALDPAGRQPCQATGPWSRRRQAPAGRWIVAQTRPGRRALTPASVRRCKLRRADSPSQVGPRRRLVAVWWWGLELLAQGVDGGPGAGGELQVEPRVGVVELMTGHLSDPLQAITQRAAMQ